MRQVLLDQGIKFLADHRAFIDDDDVGGHRCRARWTFEYQASAAVFWDQSKKTMDRAAWHLDVQASQISGEDRDGFVSWRCEHDPCGTQVGRKVLHERCFSRPGIAGQEMAATWSYGGTDLAQRAFLAFAERDPAGCDRQLTGEGGAHARSPAHAARHWPTNDLRCSIGLTARISPQDMFAWASIRWAARAAASSSAAVSDPKKPQHLSPTVRADHQTGSSRHRQQPWRKSIAARGVGAKKVENAYKGRVSPAAR